MKKKAELAVVFTTSHADTLGNACRLAMMEHLNSAFNTAIYTNQADFIRRLFPDRPVFALPVNKIHDLPLLGDLVFWKSVATELSRAEAGGIFMFHDTAPAAIWLEKPVFQYVHQLGPRYYHTRSALKRKLKTSIDRAREMFIVKGLKKSRQNFAVSGPIVEVLQAGGVSAVTLVPHGLELEKYQSPEILEAHRPLQKLKEEGCFLAAYTGWVNESRGWQLMLDSLKIAAGKDRKIVLVIAGAAEPFSSRMADFARQNQLQANLVDYGLVDASLIPGILHLADACLSFLNAEVPAYRVSPPQKVLEYFAAGRPVICNRIETHERLVEHGVNGFVIDPDPRLVTECILNLKNDRKLYTAMSDRARQRAAEYDIAETYDLMVQTIRKNLPAGDRA